MSGPIAAADIVLEQWGRWMRDADRVLGWPFASILERIRREREGAGQATAPVEIPDGIMRVDAAVAKLPDIRQKVIKVCYMKFPHLPMDAQRRKLKMSRYRWNLLLRESRMLVAYELGLC